MNKRHHTFYSFISRNIHLFILGIAFVISTIALLIIFTFDTAQLNAFGPTALIYLKGIKTGLINSTVILFLSFIALLFFRTYLDNLFNKLKNWFDSLTTTKRNFLILLICIVFAFVVHGDNVLNGYFNMDDFEVVTINRITPLGESLFIPHGNDHSMPLFKAEMRILDNLFGQNPIPYNLFFFTLFALIPFFTYLTLKRLGVGLSSFFVFLIIFTGATGWAIMLTGFNIMTIYLQIILFFSIALFTYLKWVETREKKYMFFFAIATIFAFTVDLSGVWVLPLIPLWMFLIHWIKQDSFKANFLKFIKTNKQPLLIFLGITLLFAIFFTITFTILQPNTFLSALNGDGILAANDKVENWKPWPLASNFLSMFASGVSLTTFAPDIVKLLSHPALIDKAKGLWPFIEMLIVTGNILLLWLFFKHAKNREKKFAFFLLSIIFITLAMVVVARPNHNPIPVFEHHYIGPAFYAYILFLSIGAYTLINQKKEFALKIIVPIVIILFSAQQAFSFQAARLKEEAKIRKASITEFEKTLLVELKTLGKNNPSLIIPNLSGEHILKLMPGFTLADYLLFFSNKMPAQLIQNAQMPPYAKADIVETVSSIRASTSLAFKEALRTSPMIKKYYSSPILLRVKTLKQKNILSYPVTIDENREIVVRNDTFDPEKFHTLGFSLHTDNSNGNLELLLIFNHEFSGPKETQRIRIDDFTHHSLENNTRVYHIEINLLQIHTYSLSDTISNLVLYIPEIKNAVVKDLYFK